MRNCLAKSLLLEQESSEIVLGVLVVGVGCEYLGVMHRGLIRSPERLQGARQIVVRLKVIRLDAERFANEFDALVRMSVLKFTDAQEVQRHGMLWRFL
ncbi:MAG: hypothetical protein WAM03_15835 [Pseudolabrys sp.]